MSDNYKQAGSLLRVGRALEYVALAILLIASLPSLLLRPHSLSIVPNLDPLIDDSWLLDTSYKAAHGIWFGRDVVFTYGPLYQWLSSAPSRMLGVSAGSIYATYNTLPLLLVVLATFLTVRMLLPDASPWRRLLIIVLAVVFWSPPDVRVSIALLVFAAFLRRPGGLLRTPQRAVWYSLVAALMLLLTFLLSADTGLYSGAAFVLCTAAFAIGNRKSATARRQLLTYAALTVLCFALLMIATNAVMSSAFDFGYWKSSLAIATGYRWFEATAMTKADKWRLLETLGLLIAVLAAAWRWRDNSARSWPQRSEFLLSGGLLALLMMQSGLVRSDAGHVMIGMYPAIFLSGAILIAGWNSKPWLSRLLLVVVVVATLARAHVTRPFNSIASRWQLVRHPVVSCPDGFQEIERACFRTQDAQLLREVSTYIDEHSNAAAPILVFPYQTAFGAFSHRNVAGGVLQSYLVNGPYLSEVELQGLRKSAPPFGLYFPDGAGSVAVDGIPNFTRSPELWFYLLHHYRGQDGPAGTVALSRDDSRDTRISLQEEPIAGVLNGVMPRRNTVLDLGTIAWPVRGADFLRLWLRAEYPLWWRLRKPSRMVLEMSFADETRKYVSFVVEPNRDVEVWAYPWDDEAMGEYFVEGMLPGHDGNRPAITALRLHISPLDWVSVAPSRVSIESVTAVQVRISPQ